MTERPRYWERETYRQNELVIDSVWAVIVDFLSRNTAGRRTYLFTLYGRSHSVMENGFCHGKSLLSRNSSFVTDACGGLVDIDSQWHRYVPCFCKRNKGKTKPMLTNKNREEKTFHKFADTCASTTRQTQSQSKAAMLHAGQCVATVAASEPLEAGVTSDSSEHSELEDDSDNSLEETRLPLSVEQDDAEEPMYPESMAQSSTLFIPMSSSVSASPSLSLDISPSLSLGVGVFHWSNMHLHVQSGLA